MALSGKQRKALPSGAFVYPASRKYPVPTKAQARTAGISESQRVKMHRAALSYSARSSTSGSPSKVRSVVGARHGGAIKSLRRK
jgi:hypothetical protein